MHVRIGDIILILLLLCIDCDLIGSCFFLKKDFLRTYTRDDLGYLFQETTANVLQEKFERTSEKIFKAQLYDFRTKY